MKSKGWVGGKVALVVAAGAAMAVSLTTAASAAGSASHQTSEVRSFATGLDVVDGAKATLVRNDGGVTFTIQTSGLQANHAYTVWGIIYNRPEFCSHPMPGVPCGFEDLYAPDFGLYGDPRVDASLVRGAGHVVGSDGAAAFGGWVGVDDTSESALGPGLTNARGAVIQLDVLDHGPAVGPVVKQIHQFVTGDAACNTYCADDQLAAFPAAG